MDQLVQSLKDGKMEIAEVPYPALNQGCILVRNHFSMISTGTEGKTVSDARAGIIGSIGPISTMIFGALLLGELITSSHIIGLSIVIFSSLALSRLKPAASQ